MPEQALQVAFEIKTACDEISRRLLRWQHWERKPGAHSLDALLEHIAARKQESPDYYDRMPDLYRQDQLAAAGYYRLYAGAADPRTMPPAHWTCWATRRTPLPPAMPATPSAQPATRQPTRQLQQTAHRQPCCSTKPSRRWRRATPVLPLRKTSWRSITARQRDLIICSEGCGAKCARAARRTHSREKPPPAQSPAIPRLSAAPKALPGGRIPLPAAAAPVQSRAAAQPPAAKSSRRRREQVALGIILAALVLGLIARAISMGLDKRHGFRNSGGKLESKNVWIV